MPAVTVVWATLLEKIEVWIFIYCYFPHVSFLGVLQYIVLEFGPFLGIKTVPTIRKRYGICAVLIQQKAVVFNSYVSNHFLYL